MKYPKYSNTDPFDQCYKHSDLIKTFRVNMSELLLPVHRYLAMYSTYGAELVSLDSSTSEVL